MGSAGILDAYLVRRLTEEHLVAVLVHELGHHDQGTTRAWLVSAWLAAPWRLATRLVWRAAALRALQADHRPTGGWARLCASHPAIDRRIEALKARR